MKIQICKFCPKNNLQKKYKLESSRNVVRIGTPGISNGHTAMKQAVIEFDEALLTMGLGCTIREALGLIPEVIRPAFIQDEVVAEPGITPKLPSKPQPKTDEPRHDAVWARTHTHTAEIL